MKWKIKKANGEIVATGSRHSLEAMLQKYRAAYRVDEQKKELRLIS